MDITTISLCMEISMIIMNFHILYLRPHDNILKIFIMMYITHTGK